MTGLRLSFVLDLSLGSTSPRLPFTIALMRLSGTPIVPDINYVGGRVGG